MSTGTTSNTAYSYLPLTYILHHILISDDNWLFEIKGNSVVCTMLCTFCVLCYCCYTLPVRVWLTSPATAVKTETAKR